MSKSSPSSSLGENGPVRQVLISLPAPRVKAKIPLLAFLATKVPDFGYSSSIMHTRVGPIFKKPVLPTNCLKFEPFEIVPTLMHTYSLLLPRSEEAIPFRNGGLVKHVLCSRFRLSFRGFLLHQDLGREEPYLSMHFWKMYPAKPNDFHIFKHHLLLL